MSEFISICFLLNILSESFCEVCPSLVGKTDKYPKNICHFICYIIFFTLLEGLISIFPSHYSGKFANFFCKDSHIGKFAEVSNSIILNPIINASLCLFRSEERRVGKECRSRWS